MRRVAAVFQERIGRNEATLRSINEDIERGRDAAAVHRHDRYARVRKLESSGAVAKETDPRA